VKKLYRCIVSIEFDMVVVADDFREARRLVDLYAEEEYDNKGNEFSVIDLREIRNATDVPGDWALDAIPYCDYNGDGDYTIEHYLDAQIREKEVAEIDNQQLGLFDKDAPG